MSGALIGPLSGGSSADQEAGVAAAVRRGDRKMQGGGAGWQSRIDAELRRINKIM
jgi:hypothetical protein